MGAIDSISVRLGAAALALASGAGCTPAPGELGTWRLHRALATASEVVVGVADGWRPAVERGLVPALEASSERRVRVARLGAARPGARRLRVLLGPADDAAFDGLRARLGLELEPEGTLSFAGHGVDLASGALVVTCADPELESAPLLAVLGGANVSLDPARLAGLEPTWRPGWQLVGPAGVVARGALTARGELLPESVEAVVAPPARPWPGELTARFTADELEAARAEVQARVATVLGGGPASPPATRVWRERTAFALAHGAEVAQRVAGGLDPERTLDLCLSEGTPLELRAALALHAARVRAGDEAAPFLADGLAHWAAGTYAGRDLEAWAARLAFGGLLPEVDALVARRSPLSPHVLVPMRAVLFGVIVAERGPARARELWAGAELADPSGLQQALHARLAELVDEHRASIEHERNAAQAQLHARPFRHGVDLLLGGTPEARTGERTAALSSIDRARRAGADAVAFDFTLFAHPPAPSWALGAGGSADPIWACDLELRSMIELARGLELDVMLRPNVVLSPSTTYAGWSLVEMESSWEELFDLYERVFTHCGLVAELGGVELLGLGAEQRIASVTDPLRASGELPDEHYAWKARRWRELVGRVRALYGGGLVYAASWDGERHGFGLWELFDFMGVELFAPLGATEPGAERPTYVELVGHLRYLLERASADAEAQGIRLLVTAVGFPARADAWRDPELPYGELDALEQARCLGALRDAMNAWRRRKDELAGLFVWGWHLTPPAEGAMESAYAPASAGAETALGRLFEVP